jgi:hypothetical protein
MAIKVRGILVEGEDRREYLLGIGERKTGKQKERPTLWRRDGTGWTSLEQTREASATIRDQLDMRNPPRPGLTHDEHVKWAVLESLSAFVKQFFASARW